MKKEIKLRRLLNKIYTLQLEVVEVEKTMKEDNMTPEEKYMESDQPVVNRGAVL